MAKDGEYLSQVKTNRGRSNDSSEASTLNGERASLKAPVGIQTLVGSEPTTSRENSESEVKAESSQGQEGDRGAPRVRREN